jgi:histidinol-phosphate aminotransferase
MPPFSLTALATTLPATLPFVGPETQERTSGRDFVARLGANENAFGPSPRAIAAMQKAAGDAWMYGDPESHDLRRALAQHHSVSPENIMPGEGIDGLLGLLVRLSITTGDSAVTSHGAYPTFQYHVTGFGGALHLVPYRGDHEDSAALIAKARQTRAKLLYIANPDNPMGSWHDAATIKAMIAGLPDDCLMILDEAYIDLAPQGTAPDIPAQTPNVIRMRSFSKAYGLAGARVGYAIGPAELIAAFDKVRNHFGISRISQAAAIAAIQDQPWLDHIRGEMDQAKAAIAQIATAHGLTPLPSAANFVTIDCGRNGDFARRVLAGLIARGIFVRMPAVAPLDRCIRVSCGTSADIAAFGAALPAALQQANHTDV